MNRRTLLSSAAVVAVGVGTAGCLSARSGPRSTAPVIFQAGSGGASSVDNDALKEWLDATEVDDLTPTERDDIFFMREEEKLARDVYLVLYDEWGLQTHDNISDSEQSHMDAMLQLVETYDLEDPATDTIGEFTNDELQELYDSLVEWGHDSALDSLKVGCRIEETDIQDIQIRLDRTDEPAIQTVYENLLAGSRNHLRAFYRVVTRRGGDYEPVVISQQQFDEIVESDFENGPHPGGK